MRMVVNPQSDPSPTPTHPGKGDPTAPRAWALAATAAESCV